MSVPRVPICALDVEGGRMGGGDPGVDCSRLTE